MSFKKHPDFLGNDKIRMKAFDRFRTEKFQDKLSEINYGYDKLVENASKYKSSSSR